MLNQVLAILPLDAALSELHPTKPRNDRAADEIRKLAHETQSPSLKAGLLIYIDDLETAHGIVQDDHTEHGSLWHGIIHRLEGDHANAGYWFRRAGSLIQELSLDSNQLNRDIEIKLEPVDDLIRRQRAEWQTIIAGDMTTR